MKEDSGTCALINTQFHGSSLQPQLAHANTYSGPEGTKHLTAHVFRVWTEMKAGLQDDRNQTPAVLTPRPERRRRRVPYSPFAREAAQLLHARSLLIANISSPGRQWNNRRVHSRDCRLHKGKLLYDQITSKNQNSSFCGAGQKIQREGE